MAQTAAHPVDHVIPHVPVRQWVLSLPTPLRLLVAAQPKLVTLVLQEVHRVSTCHLLGQAGRNVKGADEADSGAATLIQRLVSAANLNIHLHCLVLDAVYLRGIDGAPGFVEVPEPADEAQQAVLHKINTRLMRLLTRRVVLVEEVGSTCMADSDGDSDEARVLRPLQAAALYLPHRLRPARRPEGAGGAVRHGQGCGLQAAPLRRHQRLQLACGFAL